MMVFIDKGFSEKEQKEIQEALKAVDMSEFAVITFTKRED